VFVGVLSLVVTGCGRVIIRRGDKIVGGGNCTPFVATSAA